MLMHLLLLATTTALSDPEEADRLISRHEAILAGVRTLRATIEVTQSYDGEKSWKSLQTTRVLRSGQKELVHNKYAGAYFHGVWRANESEQSVLFDPSETLTLMTSPKVGAGIDRPPATGPGGWLNQWKAQTLLTNGEESYRGLLDRCRLVEIASGEGAGAATKILTLEPKKREDVRLYRLTFSPNRAGLITKSEIEFVDPNAAEPEKIRSASREVVDFWELGPSIVLPKTIRVVRSDEPSTINLFEVREVVCNEPIADREFRLPIPEGCVVVDHRSGQYHLWGSDGPARTFGSPADFMEWRLQQREAGPSRRTPWPLVATSVSGVCLVLIVGLIAYRRRVQSVD